MKRKSICTPRELKIEFALNDEEASKVANFRDELEAILRGHDDRIVLIVGPCSIHNVESAMEYAKLLSSLSLKVKNNIFIVMRTYFEKPRTLYGWKGLLYDPFLDSSNDIGAGIRYTREFLLKLVKMGLPCATEFLDPLSYSYFSDLISWGCIGSRTVQSPIHRQLASTLPMPIGFKNRLDGSIISAIQAAISSKHKHTYLGINDDGQISIHEGLGNRLPHVVLRGSELEENYSINSITSAAQLLSNAKLTPHLIVDCSHDNSKKNIVKQEEVFEYLIENVLPNTNALKGIMVESFLLEGTKDSVSQYTTKEREYGASHTDPCISWEKTASLILKTNEILKSQKVSCTRSDSLVSFSAKLS